MQLLKDYTDEQLVNITPEDKNTLYLLELAVRGVPLPNAVPAYIKEPQDREENKPDMVTYSLAANSYSSDKYHFLKLEDAEAVADLIKRTAVGVSSSYRDDGSHITGKGVTIEVKTNAVFSKEKYEQVKSELAEFDKNKTRVAESNNRRAKIIKQQEDVMDEINNAISGAERNITRLNELKRIFEQYLAMANNDRQLAVRFLLNAHYSEVTEYEDDKLQKIGLSREDVNAYNEASKPEETA